MFLRTESQNISFSLLAEPHCAKWEPQWAVCGPTRGRISHRVLSSDLVPKEIPGLPEMTVCPSERRLLRKDMQHFRWHSYTPIVTALVLACPSESDFSCCRPTASTFWTLGISLRTTGFNIQKFYMALALRCVFCTDIRTDSDFCFIRHWLIAFYNRGGKCLLRGTNWILI